MDQTAEMERAERLRALAGDLRAEPTIYPSRSFNGRGIVIVAGGALLFTNAYVLISVLRSTLGSALPIEVWYFGMEEISPAMAALLVPLGVVLVDALPLIAAKGARIRDGWQLKSFAIAWCKFDEVLLLDADQVPIVDPVSIFDWPEYERDGAVFWPDVVDIRAENPVWKAMGLYARRTVSFESGQVLVDKRRHWHSLSVAVRLNEAADDLYQLIYGDKDAFLLAWMISGAPFALVPHRPFVDDFFLVQRDFDGDRLFQHLTNAKWRYAGTQQPLTGFQHGAACQAALDHLREVWSGRVFNPPDRSASARATEGDLVAIGRFEMAIAGETLVQLDLRPFAEVGHGRDYDRRHWWVEDGPAGQVLVMSDGQRACYRLTRQSAGNWRGHRLRTPECEVDLFAVPEVPPLSETVGDRPGLLDDLLRADGYLRADTVISPALTEALCLLSKVVPGMPSRLARLAENAPDEETRRRLLDLRSSISEQSSPVHEDVVKDISILARGYERPGGTIAD